MDQSLRGFLSELERLPRHPGARRLRTFTEIRTGPTRSEF